MGSNFFIIITYLYDIVSENWIQVVGDINIKKKTRLIYFC